MWTRLKTKRTPLYQCVTCHGHFRHGKKKLLSKEEAIALILKGLSVSASLCDNCCRRIFGRYS
jgi:transketolase C-terminal domain/subunit